MRIISWVFTISALALIGACFFNDQFIFSAFIVAILAAWTDDWAIDIEMKEFMNPNKRDKP